MPAYSSSTAHCHSHNHGTVQRHSSFYWGRTHLEPQRGKEPPILPARVPLLQRLLDILLGLLPLADLLEGVVANDVLEALELERVARRHQVVVVCDLDEGLDLGALLGALLAHALRHLEGVALDAGDEGVGEGVGF